MKRHARGYLSQVAEPAVPNQPLLSARRDAHLHGPLRPSDMPPVQEGDETASPMTVAAPFVPAAKHRVAAGYEMRPTPVSSDTDDEAPNLVLHANRDAAASSKPLAQQLRDQTNLMARETREPRHLRKRATVERAGFEGLPAPASPQSQDTLERGKGNHTAQSAGERSAAPEQQKPQSTLAPASKRKGDDVSRHADRPATREPVAMTSRNVSVMPGSLYPAGPPQQRPQGRQAQPEPRGTRHETRVHIGTVEVRSIIAQPARIPAQISPQPRPESAVRPSVSRRATAPLSRSLAWSFGLVQG